MRQIAEVLDLSYVENAVLFASPSFYVLQFYFVAGDNGRDLLFLVWNDCKAIVYIIVIYTI